MYILDTNVVSELRKAAKADANVQVWARGVPATSLFVSVITLLELELGVMQMERRDAKQGTLLRNWLEQHVLPAFHDRALAVDAAVARQCAHLPVPDPRSERDALITATAMVHGMTVVTRNVADFRAMPVTVFNPWVAVGSRR